MHRSTNNVINTVYTGRGSDRVLSYAGCNGVASGGDIGAGGKTANFSVNNVINFTSTSAAARHCGGIIKYIGRKTVSTRTAHATNIITAVGGCAGLRGYTGGTTIAYDSIATSGDHITNVISTVNNRACLASYIGGNAITFTITNSAARNCTTNVTNRAGSGGATVSNYRGCNTMLSSVVGTTTGGCVNVIYTGAGGGAVTVHGYGVKNQVNPFSSNRRNTARVARRGFRRCVCFALANNNIPALRGGDFSNNPTGPNVTAIRSLATFHSTIGTNRDATR